MRKETFLQELQTYLKILEDQEQQDILEEYAQHIDMKIQKGLSEEDAIRDFGPVRELAAGILEAYHVKPDFKPVKAKCKMRDLTNALEVSRRACNTAGKLLKEKVVLVRNRMKALLKKWVMLWNQGWINVKAFWSRKKLSGIVQDKQQPVAMKIKTAREQSKNGNRMKKIGKAAGRGIKDMWKGLMALCKWMLRMTWNLFWFCASGVSGIFALVGLFGIGSMLVLRLQGYPLTGIVIFTLGIFLIFAAISGGCYSFMIRKKAVSDVAAENEETHEQEEEAEFYE